MANRQIFQHEEDLLLNDECKLLEDDANNKTKMFKLETLKNFIAEFVKDKIKSWEYDSLKTEGKSIIESANEIYATTQKRMVSMEEIDLVTEAGFFVDALAVKELNRKLPVFKRRNSSEAGICTPHYIMIMGTLVLQGANADYRQLFSASDLLSKILKFYDPSISNFDEGKCVITTNNGDGNAAAIHFYAPEWWGSNNAYFQYFYPATSGQIRVNYCIHYLKL